MKPLDDLGSKNKCLIALLMVLSIVFLMGCSLLDTADSVTVDQMKQEQEQDIQRTEEQEKHRAESDQALASGDVFSVRATTTTTSVPPTSTGRLPMTTMIQRALRVSAP